MQLENPKRLRIDFFTIKVVVAMGILTLKTWDNDFIAYHKHRLQVCEGMSYKAGYKPGGSTG